MSRTEWTEKDVAYILLTEGAEKKNWEDNGHVIPKTNTPIIQTGLKTQLSQLKLPFPVIPIKGLPDGNNEEEIWQIFTRVFEVIQEGDELYFDLTHGFRYLPMLTLVLGNYAKFLKNITIKSITYGNYESRDESTNEAPIIDLQSLSELQDWTSGSSSFLMNGNITTLTSMCERDLTPLIKESKGKNDNARILRNYMKAIANLVDDLNTCRGEEILKGDNIRKINHLSNELTDVIIEPMKPIIKKIRESFQNFSTSDHIKNGYIAAQWCFDNKMYQQSLTILNEMLISHICEIEGWKKDDATVRECVKSAFNKATNHDSCNKREYKDFNKETINRIQSYKEFKTLVLIYDKTNDLRNDYNHSGMRPNGSSSQKIVNRLSDALKLTQELLLEDSGFFK